MPPRRRGPVLFWYALAIIALAIGVLGIVDAAGGPVAPAAYPAAALATCGALLVLGAFWGRAGGLILLGLVSAVATAGATVGQEVDGGQIDARPTDAASVESSYRLDAGEIDLDLTDVRDLERLDGTTIDVNVDFGRIAVVVPRGLDVTVDSRVDVGDRQVFGDSGGDEGTDTVDGGAGAPSLTIDASVTFGQIEITREGAAR